MDEKGINVKPYDVEQAIKDVRETAERQAKQAADHVRFESDEAIRKLEVQARAFADMPKSMREFFEESSVALVEEVTPPHGWSGDGLLELRFGGLNVLARSIRIPPKKHRMIIFFVEEKR